MDVTKTAEMNELLLRLLDEAEGASPPTARDTVASTDEGSPSSAPSDALPTPSEPPSSGALPIAGLLGNPALLTALPTLLENAGPLLSALSGGMGSAPGATRPHPVDRHTALLCAVKPYLSPERQSAADTVIRLCRVWDALERSGISLSGLLAGLPAGLSESDRGERR